MPPSGKNKSSSSSSSKQPALPPKPALYTDDEWALAHSVPRLLELLVGAAADNRPATAARDSSSAKRPLASRATASLFLWQLLQGAGGREEAARQGPAAVAVCCKLLCAPSTDATCQAHLLACLATLAHPQLPSGGADVAHAAQASAATCTLIMAAKPPVVPWVLRQLEDAGAAPRVVAASLGLLHALVLCAETRTLVAKLLAAWDWRPLVRALTNQQALPLLGGRNASADAVAVIQLLCTPPPAAALPASSGGGQQKGSGTSSTKQAAAGSTAKATSRGSVTARTASAGSSSKAAGGAGDVGCSLAAVAQHAVLVAGGLEALLRVCAAHGSTAAARSAAIAAAHQLLAAHGREAAVKEAFAAAGGLATTVQLLARPALPLPAKAAAAGCLYRFISPAPADAVAAAETADQAPVAGPSDDASGQQTGSMGLWPGLAAAASSSSSSRPVTAPAASDRKSILAGALKLRKEQRQQQQQQPAAPGLTAPLAAAGQMNVQGSSKSCISRVAASSLGANGGGPPDAGWQLPAAPGDVAAAAAAASQAALLATWDAAARTSLAVCADKVMQAGALPGLLLLCCGPDAQPAHLVRAAAQAAAHAASSTTGACAEPAASSGDSSGGNGSSAGDNGPEGPLAAPASPRVASAAAAGGGDAGRRVGEVLQSIAEPSHASEGDDGDSHDGDGDDGGEATPPANDAAAEHAPGAPDAPSAAAPTAAKKKGKKKQGAKKDKKGAGPKAKARDPASEDAQRLAAAALQLLAYSSDAARRALVEGGALPALLPLLDSPCAGARWSARQALLALSLVTNADAGRAGAAPGAPIAHQQAAPSVKLPPWVSLANVPPSHFQLVAPLSLPAGPPLPPIPGRSRGGEQLGGRPGSGLKQGRRTSVSNLAAAAGPAGASVTGRLSTAVSSSTSAAFMDGVGASAAGALGGGGTLAGGKPSMPRASVGAGQQPRASISAG